MTKKNNIIDEWSPETMGRKGGKKSRRILTTAQARAMVKAREKKKLGRKGTQ